MTKSRFGWCVVVAAVLLVGGVAVWRPWAGGDRTPVRPDPADPLRVADDARLEVVAHWGPITESEYNFHRRWDELKNLRPARARVTYTGADFQALLPAKAVAPGELWELSDDGLLTFLRQLHPGARLNL